MSKVLCNYFNDYNLQLRHSGDKWVETGVIGGVAGIYRFLDHTVWLYEGGNRTSLAVLIEGELLKEIKKIDYEN